MTTLANNSAESNAKLDSNLVASETEMLSSFEGMTIDGSEENVNPLSRFNFKPLSHYSTPLNIEKKICEGAGGDIFKCVNLDSKTKNVHKKIIIKKFALNEREDPRVYRINCIKEFLLNLKAASQSSNVIKPIDLCTSDDLKVCLVLPFFPNGDLLALLTTVRKKSTTLRLSDQHRNLIYFKIVHMVVSLHKQNIVHRDIKPENILINGNGDLQLTDFGYAIDLDDLKNKNIGNEYKAGLPNFLNFSLGTQSFKAPELHSYDEQGKLIDGGCPILVENLKKIDIWSLGVLYFQLSKMVKPWADTSSKDRTFAKYSNFYKTKNLHEVDSLACSPFNKDPNLSIFNELDDDDLKTMLLKMLDPDPNTRYDIKQVLRSTWCLGLSDEYKKMISKEKDEELLKLIDSI